MEEEIEQREMHFNHTTPHISPLSPKPGFPGYYALISLALLTLIGCIVAVVRTVLFYLGFILHFTLLHHRLGNKCCLLLCRLCILRGNQGEMASVI